VSAALSWAWNPGCASHGASLFLAWPRKVTKKKAIPASGPSLREEFPHSIAIAGARCEGPSMAHHSYHGIHAASTPSMTITRGLLTGLSVRVAYDF